MLLFIQRLQASDLTDFFDVAETHITTLRNKVISKFNSRCSDVDIRNCIYCNFKYCSDSLIPDMSCNYNYNDISSSDSCTNSIYISKTSSVVIKKNLQLYIFVYNK